MASPPPSATTQPQQQPTPPPPPTEPVFPPSEAFDILPLIHDLLARLNPPANNTTDAPPPLLQPKDVDTEAIPIRHKIAKARTMVSELPDINRSIEEQEVEIRELEEKVRKQKEMLGAIRGMQAVKEAAAE